MNEAIEHFVTGGATRKPWPHERTSQVVANKQRNQTLPDIK